MITEDTPVTAVAFIDHIRIGRQVLRGDGTWLVGYGAIQIDDLAEARALLVSLGEAIKMVEARRQE